MKNKKFILLMLVTILFSGCTVNYDLFINDDLTINEEITASENSSSLKTKTGQEPKVAANSLFYLYKIDGVNYSFTTVDNNDIVTSRAKTSFKSLNDYETHFKSDIVKEVEVTKKDSYVTLEYKQDVPLTDYSSKSLIYDDIVVNITVPFIVTENNADMINGNTYTWNIRKNEDLKDIKITFNTNETYNSRKIDFGFFEINVNYSILIIVGLILVVIAIVLVVYFRGKKNNKF